MTSTPSWLFLPLSTFLVFLSLACFSQSLLCLLPHFLSSLLLYFMDLSSLSRWSFSNCSLSTSSSTYVSSSDIVGLIPLSFLSFMTIFFLNLSARCLYHSCTARFSRLFLKDGDTDFISEARTSSHSYACLFVLHFALNGLTSSSSRQSVISCSGVHSMGGSLNSLCRRILENLFEGFQNCGDYSRRV